MEPKLYVDGGGLELDQFNSLDDGGVVFEDSTIDLQLDPIEPEDERVQEPVEKGFNTHDMTSSHRQSSDDDRENNNVTWSPNGGLSTLTSRIASIQTPKLAQRPARRGGNQSPGTYMGTRMTYAELITEAIKSSPDYRLTLQQIYVWMMNNVPEFNPNQNGAQSGPTSSSWKNSIRHNLSLHSKFQKIQNEEPGKSSFWCLNVNEGHLSRDYYVPHQKRRSSRSERQHSRRTSSAGSNNSVFYQTSFQDRAPPGLKVTRDGLVSPSSSFRPLESIRPRAGSQPIQKPTCPPNATVHAEFQTINVAKMAKEHNASQYGEQLVQSKYPLLASIIIGKQEKADQVNWGQETPQYVYDDHYTYKAAEETPMTVSPPSPSSFLVNPVITDEKISKDLDLDSPSAELGLEQLDPSLSDIVDGAFDEFTLASFTGSESSTTSSHLFRQ